MSVIASVSRFCLFGQEVQYMQKEELCCGFVCVDMGEEVITWEDDGGDQIIESRRPGRL